MTKFYKVVRNIDGILYSFTKDPRWRCAYSPGCKTTAPGDSRLWVWGDLAAAVIFREEYLKKDGEIWEVTSRCKFFAGSPLVHLPGKPEEREWLLWMKSLEHVRDALCCEAYSVRNLVLVKRVS